MQSDVPYNLHRHRPISGRHLHLENVRSHMFWCHSHDAEYSCAKRSMREPQQKLAVLTQGSENASVSKMGTPLSALENSLTSICPPNSCSPLYCKGDLHVLFHYNNEWLFSDDDIVYLCFPRTLNKPKNCCV